MHKNITEIIAETAVLDEMVEAHMRSGRRKGKRWQELCAANQALKWVLHGKCARPTECISQYAEKDDPAYALATKRNLRARVNGALERLSRG